MQKEQSITSKGILSILKDYGATGVLCVLLVWFGGQYVQKLTIVQKEIIEIRLEVTKMQERLLSQQDIENLIDKKIDIHEHVYHIKDYQK